MLEKYPNMKSIQNHPAHKNLLYKKILKTPALKLPSFSVHNSSNVSSSLDFSAIKASKNLSFHNSPLRPIIFHSKSPEPKIHIRSTKEQEWYSNFYKQIFQRKDYRKLNNLITEVKSYKKNKYSEKLLEKIRKIEKIRYSKPVEVSFEEHKPSVPIVENLRLIKPVSRVLEPIDFKRANIRDTVIELEKKSLARRNAQMLSLRDSKKELYQVLNESYELESQHQKVMLQGFDNASKVYDKAQKRYLEKKQAVEEQKSIFMQEYYSMLLESSKVDSNSSFSSYSEDLN